MKFPVVKKIMVLVIAYIVMLASAFPGSLFVGEKIIYGGGADTPPQEKDTGVKLDAVVVGVADGSTEIKEENYLSGTEALRENDYQKASACFDMSMNVQKKGTVNYRKTLIMWARAKQKNKDYHEALQRLHDYIEELSEKDPELQKIISEIKKELE